VKGKWAAAGGMTVARSGACAVALSDGRVLVTGGTNESGVLESAELVSFSGAAAPIAPMSFARTGHVCAALEDGTVLVAGGRTRGDAATASAELYDPATNAWQNVEWLAASRTGATASVLKDGRVLIAGGEADGVLLPTLEIYNPESKSFSLAPGMLAAPRKDHAAAVLKDGRVALAGGFDGKAALDTLELFDPATGQVALAGKMSTPRAGLSATTMLDGRVFLAGGSNGETELASTEIFDAQKGEFANAAALDLPRRGHLAFRVPDNNSILITGGTWSGEPLPTSGLYIPWRDSFEPMERMTAGVSAAAGAATSGKVLVAGGAIRSAASPQLLSADLPTIRTDKEDYAPGEWVSISGTNWTPGNIVNLVVKVLPERTVTRWEGTATAGANGSILLVNAIQMNESDLGKTFELTANEQGTGRTAAAWVFTDARNWVLTFAGTGSGTVKIEVSSGTVSAPVSCGGTGGAATSQTVASTCSPNITTSDNGATITLTATANTGSTFGGWSGASNVSSSTCSGTTNPCTFVAAANAALTVTFNSKVNTTTTIGTISPSPSVVGQSYNVPVTVAAVPPATGTPTGTVNVSDGDGNSCTITLSGGAGSCNLTSTSAGAKTLTATYGGDSNFNGSSGTAAHQVNKANTATSVVSSANPSVFGQTVTFTATVAVSSPGAGTPTGTVNFKDNGTTIGSGTLSGGVATFATSALAVGSHPITAEYVGDANFNGSTSSALSQVVNKGDTTTTIGAISPSPSVVGQSYNVPVTVAAVSPATGTPTGTVNVSDGDGNSCTITLSGGAGSCNLTSTSAGAKTITATYGGDANFNGSNGTKARTVNKADTTTTITSDTPDSSVVGQPYTVSWSVTVNAPGAGTPTGTVNVSDGNGGTCSAAVGAGSCSLTSTSAGAKTLTATYGGDSNFNGSSGTAAHQVDKANTATSVVSSANPSVFGQTVTFTATVAVSSPGAGTPTGTVNFKDNGTTIGSGTLSGGVATFATSALAVGSHPITAEYVGDANFNGSTSSALSQVVNKGDTTTTIGAISPSPSVVGQSYNVPVTVAAVSPATGTPTGTVNVSDGDGNSCTITLSGGAGSCNLTSTSAGAKTITATYGGDASFNGSSGMKGHTVNKRTTTTSVTLSPSTVDEGGTSTVTVTVSDIESAGSKQYPAGTVSVGSSDGSLAFSGTCTLGNTLTSGISSCSVMVLAKDGFKTPLITAYFSESPVHFASSGSAILTVNNVAPTITAVTGVPSAPQPAPYTALLSATFTDPGVLDTHTCQVNWDDGAGFVTGTVTETNGSGSCTASKSFSGATAPGVYSIEVKITDKDSGVATYKIEYLVIYDPNAGFVTGGGWIMSPAGAYLADPLLTGKANFGFVSKYKKGQSIPEGNTEFQFHAGSFNFSSTAYQWLVVSGAKSQYKGTGTVNGTGNYGFLLTSVDGQINGGGGVDKFRIKIWDKNNGDAIVYDNVIGAPDDIDAAAPQPISGGSITIHAK
jgi:hypothetical protein